MALEIKFKKNTNDDGDQLILTDITGQYDAVDNENGYGNPNLERADVNLVPFVTFGQSDENKIEPLTYIPDVSDAISIPLGDDGVYEVSIYALPVAYDYEDATRQDLIDNAVSVFEFTQGHFQTLFAVRTIQDFYEESEEDSCNNKQKVLDKINYIFLQIWGAKSDLCNDLSPSAHDKLLNLTERIKESRL